MELKKTKYDLIIIGGGLSATFLCLNILKYNTEFKILIIEKSVRFPQKVGESFVDITALFVQSLGIDHLLKDQAIKTGVRYLFNESNSGDIKEFASPTQPGRIKGYHVNRQLFDEQMIEEAKSRGATVLRPAKIISSTHEEFNNSFRVEVGNELFDVASRWTADATGRQRYIAQKVNWKINNIELNTGCAMCHMTHDSFSTEWDTPNQDLWDNQAIGSRDFATTHFMRKHSWWWIIRINDATTSLGVVFDKNYYQVNDPVTFFTEQIKKDRQLSLLTKSCKLGPIKHIDKLSYVSEKLHSKGIALLGESGAFLDPLFSPGLELISQQVQWLTSLLLEEKYSTNFNNKAWKRYNTIFQKAYKSRLDQYLISYKIMHSFDLLSSWLMFGNYFYYARVVFPAVKFKTRLKSPLRFTTTERYLFRLLGKRFLTISSRWSKKQSSSTSQPNNICFSGVEVPEGKRFYIIPLLLMAKAIKSYLKIESKGIKHMRPGKKSNHQSSILFRFSAK